MTCDDIACGNILQYNNSTKDKYLIYNVVEIHTERKEVDAFHFNKNRFTTLAFANADIILNSWTRL